MTALATSHRAHVAPRWVLRVHRTALRIWCACLVAAVVALVGVFLFGEHIEAANALCRTAPASCPEDLFRQELLYGRLWETATKGLLYLPAVTAAFAGAALIGREMENGTASLSWTQSLSPTRWLAAKLAAPALLLAGGTALLTLLIRWVWTSAAPGMTGSWQWTNVFAATGPVGTAYVLLALAVGAYAGLLSKRPLPALGLAVAVTGIVQVLGHSYRAKLWPTETVTGSDPLRGVPDPMILDMGARAPSGEDFPLGRCGAVTPPHDLDACVEAYDLERYAVVHPASHYWPLQLVETGILLAITAAVTLGAFSLLRHRAAHRQKAAA